MMYSTSKKFFYSVSALALTLQLSMSSHVFASGKGQGDMLAALAAADTPAPSHAPHSAPSLPATAAALAVTGDNSVSAHAHAAPLPIAPDNSAHASSASATSTVAAVVVSDDGLATLLATKDYAAAYKALRPTVGTLPDDELVEFLVESNGYPKGKWKTLPQSRREEIVCKISGKPWALNLHRAAPKPSTSAAVDEEISPALATMLSQQNYRAAYDKLKIQHPHLKDEQIVEFLLTSNGYDETTWKAHGATLKMKVTKQVTGKQFVLKLKAKASAKAPSKDGDDENKSNAQLAALLAKQKAKDGTGNKAKSGTAAAAASVVSVPPTK